MGKQVAVASSVFNLMGPEDHRPHYLKSLIISGIQAESYSVADAIKEGYRNSPAIRIRNFYSWAKKDEEFQEQLGITSGELKVPVEIDMEALADQLPQDPGRVYQIESVHVGEADILYWAEQWVAKHHPDLYDTNWECDHNLKTNMITITFEDGTTEEFEAHSYDPDGRYLYVKYTSYPENEEEEEKEKEEEEDEDEEEVLLEIFIYKKGSGNEVLDSFFEMTSSAGGFYPTIPFRYDNTPITGDAYKLCKKAFRKAFNQDYDDILEQINNHENVEDIDYASVVFGVSLNTKDNASKKYIYKFLQYLMNLPDEETLAKAKAQYEKAQADWDRFLTSSDPTTIKPPRFSDYNFRIKLSVRSVHKDDKTVNFRNHYEWSLITEERGTGVLKEGKKKGDLWFEKLDIPKEAKEVYQGESLHAYEDILGGVVLCWQETTNRWRKITIRGFTHKNQIYENNSVITRATDAINDEETSGFIILLHEDVYHSLSLVDRTQMANACAYLVINCYEVKKTNFWEDWAAIILTVIVIIVTVAITVATGGAGIGLLGSAEAVGTALGFTGTTALIVGATVNALAAILLAQIITEVAVLAFGEKWGQVIGTIATAILTIGISAGVNSVNIIDALTKADNLIKISQATTNAYSKYLEASAIELNEQTQKILDETSKDISRINKMMQELYGFREIDPTHVQEYISELMERSELTERMEDFLARTLLTGSDIVEIQRQFITNFVENTITTKLP